MDSGRDKQLIHLSDKFGQCILGAINRIAQRDCCMVLITCPVDEWGKIGQPSFLTSLKSDDMEKLLIQIAGGMVLIHDYNRLKDVIDVRGDKP